MLIGIGNPLRGDDGIAPLLVQAVAEKLPAMVDAQVFCGSGLDLLPLLQDRHSVVLVDALCAAEVAPGELVELEWSSTCTTPLNVSSHNVGVIDALRAAPRFGMKLPERLRLLGVGIAPVDHFREELSGLLRRRFPVLVAELRALLMIEAREVGAA